MAYIHMLNTVDERQPPDPPQHIGGFDLAAPDSERSVLWWNHGDDDSGFCDLPKRGERLVHFPGQRGMMAFGCVEWRKAKRWLRTGKVQPVLEMW